MRQMPFQNWKPNPGIVAESCRGARHRSTCNVGCANGYEKGTKSDITYYQCHFYSKGRATELTLYSTHSRMDFVFKGNIQSPDKGDGGGSGITPAKAVANAPLLRCFPKQCGATHLPIYDTVPDNS